MLRHHVTQASEEIKAKSTTTNITYLAHIGLAVILAENNRSPPPGLWLRSPAGRLPGSAPETCAHHGLYAHIKYATTFTLPAGHLTLQSRSSLCRLCLCPTVISRKPCKVYRPQVTTEHYNQKNESTSITLHSGSPWCFCGPSPFVDPIKTFPSAQ